MRTHRDDISDVISDDTKPDRVRRGEVLVGPERRRKWPLTEKLAIVAESFEDGAVVSHVAQRHGLSPQQLFGWRRQIREHVPTVSEPDRLPSEASAFAAVVVGEQTPRRVRSDTTSPTSVVSIEIAIGATTIRIKGAVDAKSLTAVLRAVKAIEAPASGRTS
jgi:transposase